MLLALRLRQGATIIDCQPSRHERSRDYLGVALEDFRDDRMADGLHAGTAAAGGCGAEIAEPVDVESDFDCEVCGAGSAARQHGFGEYNGRGVREATCTHHRRPERDYRRELPRAGGKLLCVS